MTRHTNFNAGKKPHYQHVEEKELQQYPLVPQHHSNFSLFMFRREMMDCSCKKYQQDTKTANAKLLKDMLAGKVATSRATLVSNQMETSPR